MSLSFSDSNWQFNYTAAGVGPSVIFLSRSPLEQEVAALAQALERDFFVIQLHVQGTDSKTFAEAIQAFFKDRQLHRVHWIIAPDAVDLVSALDKQTIWSISADSELNLNAEAALRQRFADVDKPYRTSEHPL
ncbi:hypothetical protein KKG05_07760 [bacterium]|nr:hypothetical protein [bacterium]